MSDLLPVRGKQISCASCSVQRAAGLLRSFLSSDVATEAGISRGYLESVAKALNDMVGRQKHMSESGVKSVSTSTTGGLTEVAGIAEVTKRLQKSEGKKTKQKAKILSDFVALLGNEIENTTYGLDDEAHGELGREEKHAVLEMLAANTRGLLDGEDHKRKSKKSTKKKELQRGMVSGSAARVQETSGLDKKKKKHKGNFKDGEIQIESGSGELATEELISEVGVRGMEEKVGGVQDIIHKGIGKRTNEESPGDSNHQRRNSKK